MTANYRATDADLPEIFWQEGEAPEPQPVNAALRARLAVELHYAPIEEARQRKRYERAIQSERRATVQELDNGKHYIKGRKREQMWEWLQVLADQDAIGRMTSYEVDRFALQVRQILSPREVDYREAVSIFATDRRALSRIAGGRMIITDPANRTESHAMQLAFALLDAGIIQRGRFTFIHFFHDDGCKTFHTNSVLDCRCNPELIIDGHKYLYYEFAGNGRAQ